jgi:hypothetical protein
VKEGKGGVEVGIVRVVLGQQVSLDLLLAWAITVIASSSMST